MDRRMTDKMEEQLSNSKTVIGESTSIKGDLSGQEDVFYSGQFDGKMKLNSLLMVKKSGKVKGKLKLDDIVVEGEVEGEVVVKNKVEIRASGRFKGNVICSQIAIEEGAFFQGDVNMKDGLEIQPTIFKEKRGELKT